MLSASRLARKEKRSDSVGDRARCRRLVLIGRHDDRGAVFGKYRVLGDEARDFARVFENESSALPTSRPIGPEFGTSDRKTTLIDKEVTFSRRYARRMFTTPFGAQATSEETLVKLQTRFSIALVGAVFVAIAACSPDAPSTAPRLLQPDLRVALTDPTALIAQAVNGGRVRGEQDDMLRREAALPGFGGFYIDSLDHMVVYMKAGSRIADSVIRRVLVEAYAKRPEQRIQQLLPEIQKARIAIGDFTLSELISFENRVSHSTIIIPGYTGTGTSLMANRVVVGFTDSGSVQSGLSAITSLGIPPNAIVAKVWGRPVLLSSFDQHDPVRPTRGGLMIQLHNGSVHPWVWHGGGSYSTTVRQCSLGFNVRWYNGSGGATDYMMSASHCANTYLGINGATGDTVWQPRPPTPIEAPLTGLAGIVEVNEPWTPNCGTNPYDGSNIDYCTAADVMLIRPVTGVTTDRRIATSVTQGLNGAAGSMKISNYYPVSSVVTPEWVSTQRFGVAKSGGTTGTTSGTLLMPATQLIVRTCWTAGNCSEPSSGPVQMEFTNVVTVAAAGWGFDDSGGVVFVGTNGGGSPYNALGIVVAGNGRKPTDGGICTNGTSCNFFFTPWSAIQQSVRNATGQQNGTLNPVTTQ